MRQAWPYAVLLCIISLAITPAPAATCYEIIDRNDATLLRVSIPPVDLSAAGAAAREAMRQRGELLIIFETERCAIYGRTQFAGGRALTVDEIVSEWRSNSGPASYNQWSPTYRGVMAPPPAAAPASAPAPAAAPAAPAARSSSTTSRY